MLDNVDLARLLLEGKSCSDCAYNRVCTRINKNKEMCENFSISPLHWEVEEVDSVEEATKKIREAILIENFSLPSSDLSEEDVKKLYDESINSCVWLDIHLKGKQ
jgi:hypothetical protein